LREDIFSKQRKSKLNPRGDELFQILQTINNAAHQLDLSDEYGVHTTFNVTNLIPFACSTDVEADDLDLRTNSLQEGGDDGRRSRQGPITRVMARHIEE